MTFWAFKRLKVFIFCFCVLFLGIHFSAQAQVSVCFNSSCFYPETAKTSYQKEKGLMGREALADNGGMIFIYDQDIRPAFWMKNMRIPLDFVWLAGDGKVVDVHENIPPCDEEDTCPSIVSRYPLRYVLEVPAGTVQKAGITVGEHALVQWGDQNAG